MSSRYSLFVSVVGLGMLLAGCGGGSSALPSTLGVLSAPNAADASHHSKAVDGSPAPSASPSATGSPGPVSSASPQPSASPTATAKPTAPPTLVPTPVPTPIPTPVPVSGTVPLHIPDMAYYQGFYLNTRISATWLAQHYTMTQQGAGYSYGTAFLNAGGAYAMAYTDPSLVPYCYWPSPYSCTGPVGKGLTNESSWLHDATGMRLHVTSNGVQTNGHWQEHLNPGDPAVQASYAAYTAAYPGNAVFADDTSGSADPTPPGTNDYDMYKYSALPAEYCTSTALSCESTSTRYLADVSALLAKSAHPVFTNGGPTPENLTLMNGNPNVIGNMLEGCYHPGMSDATWQLHNNYILQTTAIRRYTLCYSYFASNLAAERAFNLASYWMVYDGTYAVMMESMTLSNNDQGIMPEYAVVPGSATVNPAQMSALQKAPGVYAREFTFCGQNGAAFGKCAAVVNNTGGTVPLPVLGATYTQTMDFSGTTSWYDGGTAQWTAGVAGSLGPHSAVILR